MLARDNAKARALATNATAGDTTFSRFLSGRDPKTVMAGVTLLSGSVPQRYLTAEGFF